MNQKANHCYYDRVQIFIRAHIAEVKHKLPMAEFQKHAKFMGLEKVNTGAKYYGYKTRLVVVCPQESFFSMLAQFLDVRYAITFIELAKDEIYDSEKKCLRDFSELIKCTRKKYTLKHFIYNGTQNIAKGIFSRNTLYTGSQNFKFIAYARYSKNVGNTPSIHTEWHLKGASLIRKKTGIRYIQDLESFDMAAFFNNHTENSLFRLKINHVNHGLFLSGISPRDKTSRFFKQEARKKSMRFCHINELYSIVNFLNFYKEFIGIKNIQDKLLQRVRIAYPVSQLTKYRLSTFFMRI